MPHEWRPRRYQIPLWRYLENGGKRGIAVWHRRAGKDDVALHHGACSMFERVGNYWHMLPEASQARKAVWDAVNPHSGKRRIDEAFPDSLFPVKRNTDMFIQAANGSTWQVVGSDNFNSLVGSPPIGIVFSEWALANPLAWQYLRPILRENGGWALFIYTPRGRNHAATFFDAHKADEDWFVEKLPATDTDVFSADELAAELAEYVSEYGADEGEARYNQEYLCDFDAPMPGSYYGKWIAAAEHEGRITGVPHQPGHQVYTGWDLGVGDDTSIWWAQKCGREWHILDFYTSRGHDIDHYVRVIKEKPYVYAEHLWPHDGAARELGTGKTLQEVVRELGMPVRVLPRQSIADGIQASRQLLPQCWFDETKCAAGLAALRQYRREWDEKKQTFRDAPLHDWSSHPADAFRTLAMGLRPAPKKGKLKRPQLAIV